MDTLEFKRALWKLEEQYNSIGPACVLAELDQELFLPELHTKSYRELAEIAREYQVFPEASGRVTRAALLTALTESINNRVTFTKNAYARVCAELKQLWRAYAQKPGLEIEEELPTTPTQLWLLLEKEQHQ